MATAQRMSSTDSFAFSTGLSSIPASASSHHAAAGSPGACRSAPLFLAACTASSDDPRCHSPLRSRRPDGRCGDLLAGSAGQAPWSTRFCQMIRETSRRTPGLVHFQLLGQAPRRHVKPAQLEAGGRPLAIVVLRLVPALDILRVDLPSFVRDHILCAAVLNWKTTFSCRPCPPELVAITVTTLRPA